MRQRAQQNAIEKLTRTHALSKYAIIHTMSKVIMAISNVIKEMHLTFIQE
jgi:hypothetical protein